VPASPTGAAVSVRSNAFQSIIKLRSSSDFSTIVSEHLLINDSSALLAPVGGAFATPQPPLNAAHTIQLPTPWQKRPEPTRLRRAQVARRETRDALNTRTHATSSPTQAMGRRQPALRYAQSRTSRARFSPPIASVGLETPFASTRSGSSFGCRECNRWLSENRRIRNRNCPHAGPTQNTAKAPASVAHFPTLTAPSLCCIPAGCWSSEVNDDFGSIISFLYKHLAFSHLP
jgi:hypothetical protein